MQGKGSLQGSRRKITDSHGTTPRPRRRAAPAASPLIVSSWWPNSRATSTKENSHESHLSASFWRICCGSPSIKPGTLVWLLACLVGASSAEMTVSSALSICPSVGRHGMPLDHDSHRIFKFSRRLFAYFNFFLRQIVPNLERKVTCSGYSSYK